jgi:PAS domain S-box-containing protein
MGETAANAGFPGGASLETEDRFRIYVECAPYGVFIADRTGRLLEVNPAASEITGYSRADLTEMTILDLLPEGNRGAGLAHFQQLLDAGRSEGEMPFRHASGQIRYWHVSATSLGEDRFIGFASDITQRKSAETKLEHSHQLMRYVIEHTNSAVAIHDRDLRYLFVSQQYLKQYKVTETDVIGKHHYDVFPDLPQKWRDVHQKALAGELSRADRDPYYRADGSVEWTRWECRPWYEADRSVGGIIVYTEVITDRVRSEEAIRQSEAKYRQLAESTEAMLWEYDIRSDRWTYVAPQTARVLGYSPEEWTNLKFWSDHIHPDDREWASKYCAGCTAKGMAHEFEYRFLTRDGDVKWLRDVVSVETRDGKPVTLRGCMIDISAHKKATEALRESEEFLSAIISASPLAMIIIDLNGTVRTWNAAAERILGWTEAEVLGRFPPYVQENQREEFLGNLKRVMGGEVFSQMEITRIRKDGSLVDLSLSTAPIRDRSEQVIAALGILEDISQRKSLEAQLVQAQKMESVGRLAGGVAHDFNNMLHVILSRADMVLDDLPSGSPLRTDIEEIRKAAARSAGLTRQLLAFARRQTIAPKVLDLNETIGSMLRMLGRLIGEDIDLLWRPAETLDPVRIDPVQIDQLLANLCVNARDAIGPRVGKVMIETGRATFDAEYCARHSGFVPGNYVLLAISDDGCGMDESTRSKIFEPFFTTKEYGQGTGLGLATVYGIVKQNDGFINVYSEPGQGTTFRIYLPVHMAEKDCAMPVDGPAVPCGDETLLVVEDEPAILETIQRMLERMGYAVLGAKTPGEAIRLAREYVGKIDLLLTDVVMPEMNGRDLAKNLLSLYPNLKCMFMSGYTANVIAHRGVLDEGVSYIQKPFSRQDLAKKIREELDRESASAPAH